MTLGLYEKTAGSGNWLLDHPDFRDVHETTYIKGTITDFQKLQDDPIKVAPLVKVEGYDEWLPLFFRPKDQYWDDDEHLAKDFNEDGKYFEKAWMSFRCEDEVAVMLQKGTPVAVIAFADGKPKLGEDIIKAVTNPSNIYLQCSKQAIYEDEGVGPDGRDLDFSQEGEELYNEVEQGVDEYWEYLGDTMGNWRTEFPTSDPAWYYNLNFRHITRNTEIRVIEKSIVVGPIIYIFQMLFRNGCISGTNWGATFNFCDDAYGPPCNDQAPPPTAEWTIDPPWGGIMLPGMTPYGFTPASVTEESSHALSPEEWALVSVRAKAAVYKADTKEPVRTRTINPAEAWEIWDSDPDADWTNHYEGFEDQLQFGGLLDEIDPDSIQLLGPSHNLQGQG